MCENQLLGTPDSEWDVRGAGDPSIQGFATKTSVNAGARVDFKINTTAKAYSIKIYRLGWYQVNHGAPRGRHDQPIGRATPDHTLLHLRQD